MRRMAFGNKTGADKLKGVNVYENHRSTQKGEYFAEGGAVQ